MSPYRTPGAVRVRPPCVVCGHISDWRMPLPMWGNYCDDCARAAYAKLSAYEAAAATVGASLLGDHPDDRKSKRRT